MKTPTQVSCLRALTAIIFLLWQSPTVTGKERQ
jgi:hypothetical protein